MINKVKVILDKNRIDIIIVAFLSFSLPLFFYNLGAYSLVDFDEAWYAEISRNILKHRQPFLLSFNGFPYTDHPPLGFILIAMSFLTFGVNEFAARFPSALLGFLSVLILYFTGRNLFNRAVGLGAGLMLLSSVWFILRARSGNLDSIFLFFYLLTFYFAIKLINNSIWIYLLSISLSLVFLTKSAIGLTILIPVIFLLVIKKVNISASKILVAIVLFLLILSPWIILSYSQYGLGYFIHILNLGLRSQTKIMPNIKELGSSSTFQYLHFGIREWFYPSLIALIGSLVFIDRKRQLIPIYLLMFILLVGFLTNAKTEIWHLIPLYPFLGLISAFFLYQLVSYFAQNIRLDKILTKLTPITVSFLLLLLSLKQIYQFKNEIRLFGNDVSGLAHTALAARGREEKLYLDSDFFLPSSVFYSEKNVHSVKSESPPQNSLKGIIKFQEKPFLLLTERYKLDLDQIETNKYEILSDFKGHLLVKVIR